MAWRHHFASPSTTAASVETCSPVSSGIQMWPGRWFARYSRRVRSTRLPAPMPRMLKTGLENTGNAGGSSPCGPHSRPWLSATDSLL